MRRYLIRLALLAVFLGSIVACQQAPSAGTTNTAAPAGAAAEPSPAATGAQAEDATPTVATAAGTAEAMTTASPDYGRTLTVMTHDSFNASADVIAEFEQANRVNLRFLKSGYAGAVLNRAILAKGNPLADVL